MQGSNYRPQHVQYGTNCHIKFRPLPHPSKLPHVTYTDTATCGLSILLRKPLIHLALPKKKKKKKKIIYLKNN